MTFAGRLAELRGVGIELTRSLAGRLMVVVGGRREVLARVVADLLDLTFCAVAGSLIFTWSLCLKCQHVTVLYLSLL